MGETELGGIQDGSGATDHHPPSQFGHLGYQGVVFWEPGNFDEPNLGPLGRGLGINLGVDGPGNRTTGIAHILLMLVNGLV